MRPARVTCTWPVMLFDGWSLVNAFNAVDGGFPYGAGQQRQQHLERRHGIAGARDPRGDCGARSAPSGKSLDTVIDLGQRALRDRQRNQHRRDRAWQNHMIDFVHQYESSKPKQHPVGFTVPYPGNDSDLYSSHADWISPNTQFAGSNGSKVVMNDTDHSYPCTRQERWPSSPARLGLEGLHPRGQPDVHGLPTSTLGRAATLPAARPRIRTGRSCVLRWAIRERTPTSSTSRKWRLPQRFLRPATASLTRGAQYLVYQPGSGMFTLNVLAGTYQYQWYNPSTRVVASVGKVIVPVSGTRTFTPAVFGRRCTVAVGGQCQAGAGLERMVADYADTPTARCWSAPTTMASAPCSRGQLALRQRAQRGHVAHEQTSSFPVDDPALAQIAQDQVRALPAQVRELGEIGLVERRG